MADGSGVAFVALLRFFGAGSAAVSLAWGPAGCCGGCAGCKEGCGVDD